MDGMRLYDENNEVLCDIKWCDSKDSVWETRDIPDGHEIIGLYMSKEGHEEAIQSLGFNLWNPSKLKNRFSNRKITQTP